MILGFTALEAYSGTMSRPPTDHNCQTIDSSREFPHVAAGRRLTDGRGRGELQNSIGIPYGLRMLLAQKVPENKLILLAEVDRGAESFPSM